MAVDFSSLLLLPNFNVWARPIILYPYKSRPGHGPITMCFDAPGTPLRGIWNSKPVDIHEDEVVMSDNTSELDIREAEFEVLPIKGDQVEIPAEGTLKAQGRFVILDDDSDGEGCTTCSLQRVVTSVP